MKGVICIVLLAFVITLPAVPKPSSSLDLCTWSSGFTTPPDNQGTSGIQAVPLPILTQPVLRTPLRTWRLQQTIQDSRVGHISDYKADFFYDSSQPDRVDSILVTVWNRDSLAWLPYRKMQYSYDQNTGNLLNHKWYDNSTGVPFVSLNLDFVYNQDNLCTDGYQTIYYDDVQTLIPVKRLHVLYGNDSINGLIWWNHNHSYNESYYSNVTFTNDIWGRPSVITEQVSLDSLNWQNGYRSSIVYHDSDSSTGADFFEYNAHPRNPFPNILQPLSSSAWCLFNQVQNDYWDDTDWAPYDKKVYSYNQNDLLLVIVDMYYNDGWQNEHLYLQTFDINSLPVFLTYRDWYEYFNDWDSPYLQYEFYWEQLTESSDESTPLPELQMSVSPNPFTDKVSLSLVSKDNTPAEVSIYNLKGQLVRRFSLLKGKTVVWNGSDEKGTPAATGVYLICLKQGSVQVTGKLLRLK